MATPTDAQRPASRCDLSHYDRSPELTAAEREVFGHWEQRRAESVGFRLTERLLPRLYPPLADVLLWETTDRSHRLRAIKYILQEVCQSRLAYWGWNEQHWLDLINSRGLKSGSIMAPHLLASAYILGDLRQVHRVRRGLSLVTTARLVFGTAVFDQEWKRLRDAMVRVGYRSVLNGVRTGAQMPSVLGALALAAGSPRLESFDMTLLESVRELHARSIARRVVPVSHGLAALGIIDAPLHAHDYIARSKGAADGVDATWASWLRRWHETSTLRRATRDAVHRNLLRIGVWLARAHPDVRGPADWTVEICADFLAAVDRLKGGEWTCSLNARHCRDPGKPLRPGSKVAFLKVIRRFLADVRDWDWVQLRCSPHFHLATPRSISRLLGPNPRVIDDAIWLKLVWASLNLEAADMPCADRFPPELLKALAVMWTHAGLRRSEIVRLRLGCTELQTDDIVGDDGKITSAGTLCYLTVPAGKTSTEYVKPVSAIVHKCVEIWSKNRPEQLELIDEQTGERVRHLFQFRNRAIGQAFLNTTVIPMLCAKAGVPFRDSRGRITSHRGRASTVTALANVPRGMSLLELMKWSGHRSPSSTMHYLQIKPTQLAGAFAQADRMAHMVEVVIDHEAITSGAAARDGVPWKYYDLGHSYCSNAFWSTCPHRMACAGCFFNVPKRSAKGLVIAAKQSAMRLLEEVWLSPDERAAVEGDVAALNGMLSKLRDVPTLDGRTPREIGGDAAHADR